MVPTENNAADMTPDAGRHANVFAVVGASRDTEKYGYKVFHDLKRARARPFTPVNPNASAVDGDPCFASLSALPEVPQVVSVVTPPAVTEQVVQECAKLGVRNVWMQPGAESPAAVQFCRDSGVAVVAGGPCLLVGLRTHGFIR